MAIRIIEPTPESVATWPAQARENYRRFKDLLMNIERLDPAWELWYDDPRNIPKIINWSKMHQDGTLADMRERVDQLRQWHHHPYWGLLWWLGRLILARIHALGVYMHCIGQDSPGV